MRMLFVIGFVICSLLNVHAAAYIKFDGVDGESTDVGHEGEIEIESYFLSVKRDVNLSGSGRTRSAPKFEPVRVIKRIDKASPLLFEKLLRGQEISEAQITYTKDVAGTALPVLELNFTDVLISEQKITGDRTENDSEEIAFYFSTVEFVYFRYDRSGKRVETISYSYDLEASTDV